MKNVLITGIGKGIGRSLAEKFLSEKHFVIGTFFSDPSGLQDQNLIELELDLSKSESIQKCSGEIISMVKNIDILINNAGIRLDFGFDHVDIEKLRQTLEVNLIGNIDFAERIIALLNKGAHVLNVSSSAGSLALSEESDDHMYPAYRISKTAINMYTRTLAVRLKNQAIVSSVHPGWVRTDMGGSGGDMTPEESAIHIYNLAVSKVETGQFWFKGKKFEW